MHGLDIHDIYYGLSSLGLVAGAIAYLLKSSKDKVALETTITTKLDAIHEDVVEIKTNHLPHLDARIQSIEEYLRK